MTAWILSMMLLLAPRAKHLDSYAATAAAIDRVSHEAPLYEGEDGAARTAAELVALTFYESTFDPHAVGDHGQSLGLAQVGRSNLKKLGLTADDLFDAETNLRAALRLMRISHRLCHVHPKEERLANYASGGPTCEVPEGLAASRRRMKLGADLLRTHPVRWTEQVATASVPLAMGP